MEKEVESVVNGFVGLNAKQQAGCLHVLIVMRHGDRVDRSVGEWAGNELRLNEGDRRRSVRRDTIY